MALLDRKHWLEEYFLKTWRPYFWIAFLSIAIYFKTLTFGFTNLDDKQLILENFAFIGNISNILQAFTRKVFQNSCIPYYRPMLVVTFMIDAFLGGSAPFIYHLTNILIHTAVSCLVFLFLVTLKYKREPSLIFSMIFAVHPALSQAVAWIPGRNDSLLALFAVSSFICLIDYVRNKKFASYVLHLAFFILALFTKESALALTVLFFMWVYLNDGQRRFLDPVKIGLAAVWLSISALWFVIRQSALTGTLEMSFSDMICSLWSNMPALVQFIGKLVFPVNLSVFPVIEDTTFIYGTAAILIIISAFLLSKRRDIKMAAFGLAWFLSFLVFSFIRPTHKFFLDFQEHRMYVAAIGFIIMILQIDALNGLRFGRRALIPCVSLILLFSFMTIRHSDNFRNGLAFWGNAARTSPNAPFPHLSLGFEYYTKGMQEKAEGEYKKAIDLDAGMPKVHTKLGLLYMDKNMLEEAEAEFMAEIAVCPFYDYSYLCLGVIYYREGKYKEAEKLWKETLLANPDNTDAMKNLFIYYCEKKDVPQFLYYAREFEKRGNKVPAEFFEKLGLKGF